MTAVRVVVAEDDAEVRSALVELLRMQEGIEVVGVATDTEEAIVTCADLQPDVVLIDVKMPRRGGVVATREILRRCPGTQVVALSAYEDRPTVLQMLGAGALGYVTKGTPPAAIIEAVLQASDGMGILSPGASTELVGELRSRIRVEEAETVHKGRQVDRIEAAIGGELRIVYQPIIGLRTGQIVGLEALSRFDGDPPCPPDAMFDAAAELGLGTRLEHAAMMTALRALDRLPAATYLAVNVTPGSAVEPGFWAGVPDRMLSRLVIEFTEHTPVRDYEGLHTVLAPLRRRGLRISVDDAGAGFASLRHILMLEADFIKIDASITRRVDQHRARRALASALISFARETGATIVVEGIEEADELTTLQALGADCGQGYLLGRPAPLEDLDLTALLPIRPIDAAGYTGEDQDGQEGTDGAPPRTAWTPEPASEAQATRTILRTTQRLLRVSTPEQAVAELVGLVHNLGGYTVPASRDDVDALPIDLGLGILPDALLPAAAPGSEPLRLLNAHLAVVVEDVRAVIRRLEHSTRTARDANVDALTGLLNRRAAGRALRGGTSGDVLAMVDLDHFKQVNDTHGHEAGDRVLRAFGEVLRRGVRECDSCIRYGGEEFLVMLPATSSRAAVDVLQRIAENWQRHRPLAVTFSAGVAVIDNAGSDAALAAADAALYRAKSAGRNRIEAVHAVEDQGQR